MNVKHWLSQHQNTIRNAFFLFGLVLFILLIYQLGPLALWSHLKKVGPRFFYILLVNLCQFVFYGLSWSLFFKSAQLQVPFHRILGVKISGEAVNTLTPLSWGGGDPVRVYLLRHHISTTTATASVVVDRTLNTLGVGLFMIFGTLLFFILFDLPPNLKFLLITALVLILAIPLFLFSRSQEGLTQFFLDLLKKLHLKKEFSSSTLTKAEEIDSAISFFYKKNVFGFSGSILIHFIARLLSVLEIYFIACFLDHPLNLLTCYLLSSVSILVNMIFAFIPGAMGIMEGSYAGLFSALSLNPILGASVQIIRRSRSVFWSALGMLFIYFGKREKKHVS